MLPVEADDALLGNPQAPVTLVGFLDFQCPFCARGFETLMTLAKEYGPERLRVVVKHLPLEFHPDALPAAVAAQAVRDVGGNQAFFDYAAILMAHQRGLGAPSLADWAQSVGVERELYNEAVSDEATVRAVATDARTAARLGIDGTPAFFVNGVSIAGAQPIENFRAAIDAEAQAMAASEKQGKSWAAAYQARLDENLRGGLAERILSEDPRTYRALVDGSPVKGPADALVTLVEFSDFECPYCKTAQPTVDALSARYGNKLRVVFKHLPLPFHPHAEPAARLADAVYRQKGNDAFWRAVDRLFAISPKLDEEALVAVGVELGLKADEARVALTVPTRPERLTRDATLAEDLAVNSTPHFFVNGKRLSGALPLEAFEAVIDSELEAAQKLVAAGTPPAALYDKLMADAVAPGAPTKVSDVAPDAPKLEAAGHPARGPKTAPIVIHIFSDFQCPYCKRAESTLDELDEALPGKIRFVWHNLPLSFHAQARPAARAALEAFSQKGDDGFWKMHAALFNFEGDAHAISDEQLTEHAKALGLNVPRFEKALKNDGHEEAIAADEGLARSLGISGTPAFVVGDYLITGARPLAQFLRVANLVLAEKKTP
jgi:protein-disulfide isomerase